MPAQKLSQEPCTKAGRSGDAAEGSLGRHRETREGFAEFHPNHKATAGRRGGKKKKVKVMLRAKGQILSCRGNSGTRRKCRLIKNGLCWLKFASPRVRSVWDAAGSYRAKLRDHPLGDTEGQGTHTVLS